jgi:YD repeat-containing protein
VAWLDGRRLSYTYSDADTPASVAPQSGLLIAVTDQNGRSAQFVYEQPAGVSEPRIRQITSGTDNTFIAYDSTGNLSTLTLPDGKTRKYLYERSDLPWAVTGVVDENNTRLATYGYDSEGRAIETQWAGGAQRYVSSYDTAPGWTITETFDTSANIIWHDHYWVAPTGLRVTGPEGAVSEITTTQINGKVYLTGRSQPAGAGCSASTSSQDFDAGGNLSRRDDFNGTRSCFSNDLQRGLVLATVEGLAQSQSCAAVTQPGASLPALSRLTSTEWHPDWPLPTRTAEPKLLTTNVYNGQPDPFNGNAPASCAPSTAALPDGKALPLLCLQRQQATLDTDGSKRFDLAGKPQVPGDANGVDPSYASVSLLLHLDGSGNAAGLVDSSVNGYPVSAFGNAAVNAGASRYGSGGLSLDGSYGSYVTAPSAALDVGGNDFTVEAWVRLNAYGNFATLLSNYGNGGARGFDILTGSNGSVTTRWSQDGSSDAGSLWHANQIPLNTWAHVAVVRQGTALRIFLNGVPSAPVAINGAIFTSSTPVNIGRTPDTGQGVWYLNGAVDDVRITKGLARYTAAFTPSTAGLPGKPVTPAVPSLFNTAVADRVQRWTYDQDGRVLTAKSTRSGVTVSTSSTYFADTNADHTKGDLQSFTSSAGEVTTFTQYNRAGQVLQSIDGNGIVTVNTYDLRQRLLTTAVDGLTTTYEYDALGQLKKATLSNGSWVGQDYDDARRLKAVYDDQGNRIDYELDRNGQRVGQTKKDPNGRLKVSLNRVMDALNRAQRTTGGEE